MAVATETGRCRRPKRTRPHRGHRRGQHVHEEGRQQQQHAAAFDRPECHARGNLNPGRHLNRRVGVARSPLIRTTDTSSFTRQVKRRPGLTKRDRLGIPTRADRSEPLALSTAFGVAGQRPHRGRRRSRTDDADSRLSPGDLPHGGARASRRPRVVVPGPARDSAAGPATRDAIDEAKRPPV